MSPVTSPSSSGLRDGLVAATPLSIAAIPFGLVIGIIAAGSPLGPVLGAASSVIIFAGAAQLATLQLVDAGAVALVVVATALVINARFVMYSAALAPSFREFPVVWRFALPYLMTDQAFALSITRFGDVTDPVYRRRYYLGAGGMLWMVWQAATITGVVVGGRIPEAWALDFTVPLVFLVLLVPAVTKKPDLVAALVAGAIAVAAHGAPYGLGLIIAACSGIAAGVATRRFAS